MQLLRRTNKNWLGDFKELSLSKKEGKSPPNGLHNLTNLIRRAAKFYQRAIIAIDALDECQANSDRQNLIDLLRLNQSDELSIFLTCRDEYNFRVAFDGLPSISLDSVTTSLELDIQMFVSTELEGHRRFSKSQQKERDEIVRIIAKRAQGMYVLRI